MARRSDPALVPTPSADRFRVWNLGTDAYDHEELAENWDRVDAIIGQPSTGVWPATHGENGGIYREIRLLQKDRLPIGAVIPWFYPFAAAAAPATIRAAVPNGFALCDGSIVTDHDFTGGAASSFYTPNLIHAGVIGASPDVAVGKEGVASSSGIASAANAPGIVSPTSSGNGDAQVGSNLVQIVVTIPDHYHTFRHVHMVGDTNATETLAGGNGIRVQYNAASTLFASNTAHVHQLRRLVTTYPRGASHEDMLAANVPDGASAKSNQFSTSLQRLRQSGTTEFPARTESTFGEDGFGNAAGHNLGNTISNIDNRPESVPLLYIMKVKYSTDPS